MLLNLIGCALFGFLMWQWGRSSCMAEKRKPNAPTNHEEPPEAIIYEEMVRCEYCGLNLPAGEAVERFGKIYCCVQHASNDQQKNQN
jgi:hypothetical protein